MFVILSCHQHVISRPSDGTGQRSFSSACWRTEAGAGAGAGAKEQCRDVACVLWVKPVAVFTCLLSWDRHEDWLLNENDFRHRN